MGWVENVLLIRRVDSRQIPTECYEVVLDNERWVVESFTDRVDIRDKDGNIFFVDDSGRCFVTKGPMKDIFGETRNRVEIPDPFCECVKKVVEIVLTRRID